MGEWEIKIYLNEFNREWEEIIEKNEERQIKKFGSWTGLYKSQTC